MIIENFNKDLPLEFEIDCEDFYENLPVYFTVHSQFEFSLKYAATKSLGYVFENEGFRYTFNIDRSGRYALKMYDIDSSRTSTIASGVYGLVKNPINFMFEVDGAHVDILINNESIHQFSYSGFEWKKFSYFVDSEMIGKFNYYKIVNDIFPNKSI